MVNNSVSLITKGSPEEVYYARADAFLHYTEEPKLHELRQSQQVCIDVSPEVLGAFVHSISPVPRASLPTHDLKYDVKDVDDVGMIKTQC